MNFYQIEVKDMIYKCIHCPLAEPLVPLTHKILKLVPLEFFARKLLDGKLDLAGVTLLTAFSTLNRVKCLYDPMG